MEPGKTSFFQAIGIPTKIARGTIEIVADVVLVKTGEKVSDSAATLLNMMKISPFTFGLTINQVYDNGAIFTPEILDISDEKIEEKILSGIKTIAALSLSLNYPTLASIPHSIVNAYKNVLAIAIATEISFPLADKVRFVVANDLPGTLSPSPPVVSPSFLYSLPSLPVGFSICAAPCDDFYCSISKFNHVVKKYLHSNFLLRGAQSLCPYFSFPSRPSLTPASLNHL
jgi:hypothetical protein